MDSFELADELTPSVRRGDTEFAIRQISEGLRTLPDSPFHSILTLEFSTPPSEVADHFDRFAKALKKKFPLGAIYAEAHQMWDFSLFGFREFGGHDDYDWLASWDSDETPKMKLAGLEAVGAVWDSQVGRGMAHQDAYDICALLVTAKFQDLIRRSVPLMREVAAPVLATCHDFDLIAEFRR